MPSRSNLARLTFITQAALLASLSLALADDASSKEKAIIADHEMRLAKYTLKNVNYFCETTISASYDWQSFAGEVKKLANDKHVPHIYSNCEAPLRHLGKLCHEDGFKKSVQDQVSSFECRLDDDARQGATIKDGKMIFTINFKKATKGTVMAGNLDVSKVLSEVEEQLTEGDFNLRQARLIKSETGYFEKLSVKPANRDCDTKIKAEIDWSSFVGEVDKRLDKNDKLSIKSACGLPLDRIRAVCRSEKKKPVQTKIKRYQCAFGGKKKGSITLKKGTLDYRVDFMAKKPLGRVDKFLIKKRIAKKRIPLPKNAGASLRETLAEDNKMRGGKGKCRSGCNKRCKGARNKSKCLGQCRRRCSK